MKIPVFLFFVIQLNISLYCQSIILKEFTTDKKEIEFDTQGLDEIEIVNSETDQIKIKLINQGDYLLDVITKEVGGVIKISFKYNFFKEESKIFRKYITKRLNRASIVISIPKKKIVVLGNYIDIISKSYKGDLRVFIDKGFINLHEVKGNVEIKLFQGNIAAFVSNSELDIETSKGKIIVNDKEKQSPYKEIKNNSNIKFTVNSIKASVFLVKK